MPDDIKPGDSFIDAACCTGHGLLRRDGIRSALPSEIQPGQLRGCLWEILYSLAARRIFFTSTDHLSDAELYAWLHREWLPRSIAHLPLETDCNIHVNVIGTGSEEDNQIWLRYYADEELREKWKRDFPEDDVPPCEAAPCDRDRWLPKPAEHCPSPAVEESIEFSEPEEATAVPFDELHDPLQLEGVDREIHIDQPAFESSEADNFEFLDDTAPSREETLQEPTVGVETENWVTPHEDLTRSGVILPPPDELTDEALPAKLWELLHELACRGFYLLHTDHLSERALYTRLWREDLREPAILPGRFAGGGWFHDFVGSGSDEDTRIWLRYYANDLERAQHANSWPNEPLPPKQERPFRRDHRLPQGPF